MIKSSAHLTKSRIIFICVLSFLLIVSAGVWFTIDQNKYLAVYGFLDEAGAIKRAELFEKAGIPVRVEKRMLDLSVDSYPISLSDSQPTACYWISFKKKDMHKHSGMVGELAVSGEW